MDYYFLNTIKYDKTNWRSLREKICRDDNEVIMKTNKGKA